MKKYSKFLEKYYLLQTNDNKYKILLRSCFVNYYFVEYYDFIKDKHYKFSCELDGVHDSDKFNSKEEALSVLDKYFIEKNEKEESISKLFNKNKIIKKELL